MGKRKMTSSYPKNTPKKSRSSSARLSKSITMDNSKRKAAVLVNPKANAGPLPASYAVSMKSYGFAAKTAVAAYEFLRHVINSPGSPQSTLTSNQPLGYDELSLLYGRYKVVGGKYTINLYNRSATVICDCVAYVSPTDDSGSTDPIQYMEQPGVPASKGFVLTQNSVTFSSTFNVAKIVGVDKNAVLDDNMFSSATGASGAGTDVFLNIGVWSQDATNAPTYNYSYEIIYDMIFYDRIALAKS